ncbi:MAG: metallophosphoesterase [Acidobacteriota bacterium]|nr:metallophosphoesterase [Acidobacteriota bacterium]MDQ5836910.1 metallophosphoesterase [Acidobacteriota bacterium]
MARVFKTRLGKICAALAVALSLLFALGVWAFWLEPASITVRRVHLEVPSWHAEHSGLKIAVLTDLHVGSPHMGLAKLRRVVEHTNDERPDIIILLGDFVVGGRDHKGGVLGGSFVEPEPIAAELRALRAPLGVYAVLGNHDWWFDGERVAAALRGAGVKVLENQAVRVESGGRGFWLAGVADLWTRRPDIAGALGQVEGGDPVLLLTHNPDIFPDVPARVSLTLAGHTHGGQVNLPLVGRPVVPSQFGQRYAMGHVVEQGRHLFVSGGIGTSIIPVRFRVPPEIIILTLSEEGSAR